MKTKIFIILLSVVAIISFSALTSGKQTNSSKDDQSYQSSGGQTMSDPHQFD